MPLHLKCQRTIIASVLFFLVLASSTEGKLDVNHASLTPQNVRGAFTFKHSTLLPAVARDCTITIEPFLVAGTIHAIYLPKGVDVAAEIISKRSISRLDYDLVRNQHTRIWSLKISLPTCGARAISRVALWCARCNTIGGATATIFNTLIGTAPVEGGAAEAGPTVVIIVQEGTIPERTSISSQGSTLSSYGRASKRTPTRKMLQNSNNNDANAADYEDYEGESPPSPSPSPSRKPEPSPSPSPTTQAPSPSPPPAAAPAPGPDLAPAPAPNPVPLCNITFVDEVRTFRVCYPLRIGTNFKVYYSLEKDPLDATSSILSMGMQANSSGWIGVGFPTEPGNMINAGAAILKTCTNCTTGASINQYYLNGTEVADVNVDSRLNMSDFKASSVNGVLSGLWKMKLPGVAATTSRRRRLFQLSFPASNFPLIYASGPISESEALLEHRRSDSTSGSVNLLLGLPGNGSIEATEPDDEYETYKNIHIWMALVSWGFVIPVSILTARYFKNLAPVWFIFHRGLSVLGFLMAVAAVVLGMYAADGFSWDTEYPVHRNLGITCTALAFVQMFSIINWLRPKKESKWRPYWYYSHSWIGRSAAAIGIANIYYGMFKVEELGLWAWATYSGILGVIVALAVMMEITNLVLRRRAKGKGWKMEYTGSRANLNAEKGNTYKANMGDKW